MLPPGLAESQMWHVNQNGEAVGNCEIFDATGKSISDFACSVSKRSVTPIPKLNLYKKMECMAISDAGVIVGHAYAPERETDPPLQAIAFDPRHSHTVALPNLELTKVTLATSISGDGKTIAGVCSGRTCIWARDGDSWVVTALPQKTEGLVARNVCLSDNGTIAVASQAGVHGSQLTQWTRDALGIWQVTVRLDSEAYPYDVNNVGVVVGVKQIHVSGKNESRGFVLAPGNDVELIKPFDGENFSTARSINNSGVVVGWSDGLGDDSKWPRSFVWKDGRSQQLEFPTPSPNQAFAINDMDEVVGMLERKNDPHAVGFFSRLKHQREAVESP